MKSIKFLIADIFNKKLNIHIDKIVKQSDAYTNLVYKVDSGNESFIYKKFEHLNLFENLVLEKMSLPEILVSEHDYRIERFIKHKKVDFKNDCKEIAVALKKFHTTEIKDFINFKCLLLTEINKITNVKISEILENASIKIFNIIKNNQGKNVLCHNDLQPNNILKTNTIIFIDFEYCSIGNNLVDIANLFCETEIDYEKNVYIKGSGYTEEDRIFFLMKYFNKNDVKCELQKINNLEVVSHFLWFVWSVYIIKSNNNSEFDYKKYSLSRLQYLNNIFTSDEIKILLSYLNSV